MPNNTLYHFFIYLFLMSLQNGKMQYICSALRNWA